MEFLKFFVVLLVVLVDFGHGQGRNVFIRMNGGVDSVLNSIKSRSFSTRAERAAAVREALINNAAKSQSPILNFLNTQSVFTGIKFESFWGTNEIFVSGVSSGVLNSVQTLFGSLIAGIADETFATFNDDMSEEVVDEPMEKQGNGVNYTWGVRKIQAYDAWTMPGGTNGAGAIIAGIDTGVRWTHEALRASYLGGNAWFDPSAGSDLPNDNNGHGSHTMGTMVGSNGIGVAPGLKWIACKGCADNSCAERHLKRCGEWIICPTDSKGNNPDCTKTPDVANNSWGGSAQTPTYLEMIRSWIAAGIVPIFSNGNSGPLCYTTGSPAYLQEAIGIGSIQEDNRLSSFSSKGPVCQGFTKWIKPDLSGPGTNVYSAWYTSDTAYKTISGTSMSGPHVAAVAGLMRAARKSITVEQVRKGLVEGCTTEGLKSPLITCFLDGSKYPNNQFGYGLVNAKNSVNKALGR